MTETDFRADFDREREAIWAHHEGQVADLRDRLARAEEALREVQRRAQRAQSWIGIDDTVRAYFDALERDKRGGESASS